MAVKRKVVKKKAVKKTVRKKIVKRKLAKKKVIKKKIVKKKAVKRKVVRKKVKKPTTRKKVVTNNKPKKRGAVMAKRKKSTKKSVKQRRFSGAKKQKATTVLMNIGLAIAGAVGASMLVSKIPVKDPRVKALIPLGVGVVGAIQAKKPMMRSAALGIAFSGGMGLIKTQFPNLPMLAGEDENYLDYVPNTYEQDAMLGQPQISDTEIDDILDDENLSGMENYAGMTQYAGGDWVTSDDM